MTRPHITIVTFGWPPRNSIGAHRPYSWAKYWSAGGANVRIITARKYPYDAPLDLLLPPLENVEVIEVDYRSAKTLIVELIFKTPFVRLAGTVLKFLRRKTSIDVDPRTGWFTAIIPRLHGLAADTDIVVSTYGPAEAHLIANKMKINNPKLLWVADYRDLWSQSHHSFHQSEDQREAQRCHECIIVGQHADLLSTVSEPLGKKLSKLHSKPVYTITNGFDLDPVSLEKNITRKRSVPDGKLKIVYTGRIYPGMQDPTPLLKAVVALEIEMKINRGDIQVHFYGGQVNIQRVLDDTAAYQHIVYEHGHVKHDAALNAQQDADLLLLLESPLSGAEGVLTGKIFEYISSGVPILSLGSRPKSEIDILLKKTATGFCAGEDVDLIRQKMIDVMDNNCSNWFDPKPEIIMKHSRQNQAKDFMNIIKNSIREIV